MQCIKSTAISILSETDWTKSFYCLLFDCNLERLLLSVTPVLYLCWFALVQVWFWFSSPLLDLSVRLGCFFPVVVLLGVVTSGPETSAGDSLTFDLWPSPDAFWLSLALVFSRPGLWTDDKQCDVFLIKCSWSNFAVSALTKRLFCFPCAQLWMRPG